MSLADDENETRYRSTDGMPSSFLLHAFCNTLYVVLEELL